MCTCQLRHNHTKVQPASFLFILGLQYVILITMNYLIPETDARVIHQWLLIRMASENTVRSYRKNAEQFFEFTQKPLTEIGIEDATRFYGWLRSKFNPATQKQKLDTMSGLFEFARDMDYIRKNPFKLIQRPKFKKELTDRILTPDEVDQLINGAVGIRDKMLIRLLYYSGGRVTEVISAKWSDLVERQGGGQITLFGKDGVTRAILIPSPFWEELNAFRTNRRDLIFPGGRGSSDKGKPLNRKSAWYIVNQAAKRAKLGNVSPHWLRHAHATEALENGAPLHLLKESLGHRSIATTAKYLHTRPMESSSSYLRKR
jgi:integrase/recombinase XerD